MMREGVSVIVCCYNSSARLPETLSHLINQVTHGIAYEIIIVDNVSTDNTVRAAQTILDAHPHIDYSVLYEHESGLSYARIRGYKYARYNYLLFCDDDNWLAPDYIYQAYTIMQQNKNIAVLGCFAEPVFEIAEPFWFKDFAIDFAVGPQSKSAETLVQVDEVYGAGFVIRKTFLERLYNSSFKTVLSDRKGSQLISGGDVELCYMARYLGYQIWYNSNMRLKHFMTAARLNWPYMKKLYAGNGISNVYTLAYQRLEREKKLPSQALRLPFWLDTLINKAKAMQRFKHKVQNKMDEEGNADVLRYIAMRAEIKEIWRIKQGYTSMFNVVLQNQNAGKLN